jgi:drug/metabolite transporter (DMT)-like permease
MPSGPGPTRAFVVSHTLSCSTLWASSFLFMKLSAAMGPLALASCRGVVAALAIGTWFALQGQSVLPRAGEWRHWLVLGTFNGWGPNVLVAYALTQIATGTAAMIQAASPLIVAVIAHLMFAEERLSPTRLVGVFVGFVGMALLIGPAALPDSGVSLAGVLAMTAVSLSYAVGSIYARTARETAPARLGFGQQVCSGAVATILTLAVAGPAAYEPMSRTALPLVALGVLATAIPIVLFMRLIRYAGPTRASMVGYLMPVWTTILAILFLGETVGLRELLGGAVVLAGVGMVSLTGRLRS